MCSLADEFKLCQSSKRQCTEQEDVIHELREQLAQAERRADRLEQRIKREGKDRVQELQERVEALEGERDKLHLQLHDMERKLARFQTGVYLLVIHVYRQLMHF